MRIGLFGGSFDPIHMGHLILAEEARARLQLEKIIFIPSHTNPLKKEEKPTDARHRYEMVNCAIDGNPSFYVSDIEIRRGGTSYTVDTVRALREEMPEATLVFLLGSDSLQGLHAWKSVEELFCLCRFVIAKRPGFPLEGIPDGFEKLDIPQIDISSRGLRQRISEGRPITYLVPKAVEAYILKHRLYQ